MSFTLSNFKKTISANLNLDGERIFRQGGVKKIDSTKNNEWTAEVLVGTETFNVEIMIDNELNILDHFCDCPSETDHCKHQVATFLKLKEVLPKLAKQKDKKPKVVVEKKKKLTPLEEILSKTSFTELQDFVRKACGDNKAFQSMLMLHFSGKNESNNHKYYFDALKTALSGIKKSGYLNKTETKKFLKSVEELENKAISAYNNQRFAEYAPVALALVEAYSAFDKRLDDADYRFKTIVKNTLEYLGTAIKQAPYDIKIPITKEVFEVFDLNLQEMYDQFNKELFQLIISIGKEPDLETVYLNFIDTNLKKNVGRSSFWSLQEKEIVSLETELVGLKRDYLVKNGKQKDIQKLLAQHLNIPQFKREHIEFLMESKQYEDARTKIKADIVNKDGSLISNYVNVFYLNLLDLANEKLNDKVGQVESYMIRFRAGEYKQISVLEKIKALLSPELWDNTFNALVKEIIQKHNQRGYFGTHFSSNDTPLSVGHLYVFDKRWNELEKMVTTRKNNMESVGAFSEYLLIHNFGKYFDYLQRNIPLWLANLQYSYYDYFGNILLALQNYGPETAPFLAKIVAEINSKHGSKKKFIEALLAKRIHGVLR